MSMIEWAENEVRIACERMNRIMTDDEFDEEDREHEHNSYEGALKAYKSLCGDIVSMYTAKHILDRLCVGLPLTPIEDTDDIWNLCSHGNNDKKTIYQCKRMSTLFKNVYPDGTVKYNAINRVLCYDSAHPYVSYHSTLVDKIIDELIPITMPYYLDAAIKVYCHEFLVDRRNGDFDTVAILYATMSDGTRTDINRYFKRDDWLDNNWVEISHDEYMERHPISERRD